MISLSRDIKRNVQPNEAKNRLLQYKIIGKIRSNWGLKKHKYLPKMTKNGLKWPKFGTFIVIKWFYEKIGKKNSRQILRGAILHLPRKNNQI